MLMLCKDRVNDEMGEKEHADTDVFHDDSEKEPVSGHDLMSLLNYRQVLRDKAYSLLERAGFEWDVRIRLMRKVSGFKCDSWALSKRWDCNTYFLDYYVWQAGKRVRVRRALTPEQVEALKNVNAIISEIKGTNSMLEALLKAYLKGERERRYEFEKRWRRLVRLCREAKRARVR
jgi:hypothetical protein